MSGNDAVSVATANHAAAADTPAAHERSAELARTPRGGFCSLDVSSAIELTADLWIGSAQNVKIDALRELGRVGASFDDVHCFELVGVEQKLLLQHCSDW